jgi:hypothetical protein
MCPRNILCFDRFFSYFTGFLGVIAGMKVAQSAFYGGYLELPKPAQLLCKTLAHPPAF